jgi:3-deoxy-7-phosphoheptulonate synthase
MKAWSIDSWQSFPAQQQPQYPDQGKLAEVLHQLARLPPLVTSWEVDRLSHRMASVEAGEAWVLQGGDCAESFSDCESEQIAAKLKVLLQMSLVLVFGARCPVIRVGRIAGQYAKPRSQEMETKQGVTLPSFRGDIINRPSFTVQDRTADPMLMLRGYERSALTLNFIRGLSEGGFADLHHPENWDLTWVKHASESERYKRVVAALGDAIRFMDTFGSTTATNELRRVDFYTSHEALLLPYEQSLTRRSVRGTGWYNLGTHLPWIGERTRALDGAHMEYFRGIRNPIAVKVGPSVSSDEAISITERLNPDNVPGRLTLIHRMGNQPIVKQLPPLVEAIRRAGRRVVWVCDPMHGNTVSTESGTKTRHFDAIVGELRHAFAIHRSLGSRLGGVHLELTGDNVTECVGGPRGLTEGDLRTAYHTTLDPRLNYDQAMEIAFAIAGEIASNDPRLADA